MEKQPTEKNSRARLVMIVLLVLVIALISVIGYFAVTDKPISVIYEIFETNKENTVLLDEFVVNLKAENSIKNYLKIEVALMYTNGKHEKIINSNTSKIRDVIITDLSKKSAGELLDKDNLLNVKEEIMNDVNAALDKSIVKDVYFTNMVIQ